MRCIASSAWVFSSADFCLASFPLLVSDGASVGAGSALFLAGFFSAGCAAVRPGNPERISNTHSAAAIARTNEFVDLIGSEVERVLGSGSGGFGFRFRLVRRGRGLGRGGALA